MATTGPWLRHDIDKARRNLEKARALKRKEAEDTRMDYTHAVITKTERGGKAINADVKVFFVFDDADAHYKAQSKKGLTCEFWSYLEVN